MSKILNNTTRNIYLANCLYDCIEDNNIRAVKKLLQENGANPNIIIPDRGISPFHLAIGSGDENTAEEITKMFLGYGGNPNIESVEKLTPVHIAAAWGRLKILKILLNCGGDPNLKDEEGKLPLDYAKIENYNEIVDFLQNFLHEYNSETNINSLKYDLTLNKLIINNGVVIAEYGSPNRNDPTNDLNSLPKNTTNTYVNNWCIKHAINNTDFNNKLFDKNLNITNSDIDNVDKNSLCNSSEDFSADKNYSRESGILTIHDNSSDNILDKCIVNSDENTTAYLTCESINMHEQNIASSLITLDLSESVKQDEIWNITSDTSVTNIPGQLTANKEQSLFNIAEEYKYVDKDEGIVLIEKRILVHPKIDDNNESTISNSTKFSSLPSVINYDTDTLRNELTSLGEQPGPITKTTKRVYLKKLKKLQKYTFLDPPSLAQQNPVNNRVYSVELEKTLRNSTWTNDLTSYKALESIVSDQFSKAEPSKRWREGVTKASFTYLLLDPRITLNLPLKYSELQDDEIWKTFLSAIFYVGKGKRSRPYSHLYQAVNYWKKGETNQKNNKKVNYILDIWQSNFGVVCLHIFQNVIPVEAYTREAAMINALKLQNLCNSKLGDFYGISATWPERKKRLLGVYLLYRAMLIFLNEGERQLRPDDIGK